MQPLGSTEIIRGHNKQQGVGGYSANTSIHRYFDITPTNYENTTARFYYLDAELDGHAENSLIPFQDVGNNWNALTTGFSDVSANWMDVSLTSSNFSKITFSSDLLGENSDLFSVKVFLEGPYNSAISSMTKDLIVQSKSHPTNPFPLTQPYNIYMQNYTVDDTLWLNPSIYEVPYIYSGTESVADYSQIPSGAVDWIAFSIYNDAPSNPSASKVFEIVGFLMNDGRIVDVEGNTPKMSGLSPGNYYVVVHHRNHIPINSTYQMNYSNNIFSYDFTTADDKAYFIPSPSPQANVYQQKEVEPGVWAMMSGDGTGNGVVDAVDANKIWIGQNGNVLGEYLQGDFNLNGFSDLVDYNASFINNNSRYSVVPYNN